MVGDNSKKKSLVLSVTLTRVIQHFSLNKNSKMNQERKGKNQQVLDTFFTICFLLTDVNFKVVSCRNYIKYILLEQRTQKKK